MIIVQFTSIAFAVFAGLFVALFILHRFRYNGALIDAIKNAFYSSAVFVTVFAVLILVAGYSYYSALNFWNLVL